MKSAIELYQEAYSLHFKENRPDLAKELYREIIEKYPDSDEREYAQFLLTKITPQADTETAERTSSFPLVAAISFFIGITLIIANIGFFVFITKEQKSSMYMEKIILAINSIQSGNSYEALLHLSEAKYIQPKRIGSYSLASEIYVSKKRFDRAMDEYRSIIAIDPSNMFALERLKHIKELKEKNLKFERKKKKKLQNFKSRKIPRGNNNTTRSKQKSKKEIEPEPKILDNPDINYF